MILNLSHLRLWALQEREISSDEEFESIAYPFMGLERKMETDSIDGDARVLTIGVFVLIVETYSDDQRSRSCKVVLAWSGFPSPKNEWLFEFQPSVPKNHLTTK